MTLRHFVIPCFITLLCCGQANADSDFAPVYKPSLHIGRSPGDIRIDGRLNDPGWRKAATAEKFVENSPGDQIEPPVDTRALMTYDDEHLYVAIIAYDNPAETRASWCERDRAYSDDNVGFFFDTYGDAAWAYTLNVNPYGVQCDAIWTNGFGEDDTYDLIWESAGQITDSGYQVEMAIPFSSLRFPDRPEQVWRIDIWRHHHRESHYQISWSAYDRDETCWACQWGTLTGLKDIQPGRGIEIIPAVIGFQSGDLNEIAREALTDSLAFVNDDFDGDLSVNAKYSIASNATAEFTINPDFSQVEADADQIDVNSTTALSFPEKRPFFQEGSDLFRSLYDAVYTRSINDPIFAGKATARFGRTSLAYLGAYDEHSPIITPFEDFSTPVIIGGKSLSNVFKLRRTLGSSSRLGLLLTDRRFESGGGGTAVGLDGSVRLAKSWDFKWQALATHTREIDDTALTSPDWMDRFDTDSLTNLNDHLFDGSHTAGFDGESYWGHGYIGLLDYSGSNAYGNLRYSETSRTFRLDNGYEPYNSRRQASLTAGYRFRFDDGLVENFQPQIVPARLWNTAGTLKNESIALTLIADFRLAQTHMHGRYRTEKELYAGRQFDGIMQWHNCFSARPSEVLSFSGYVNYGHLIARNYVVMGKETTTGYGLEIKPHDRAFFEVQINFAQSRHMQTNEMLYKGFVTRARFDYQASRELSIRFVTQYNDFYETWDIDPLVTYRLNPFTLFYVGSTYDYGKLYGLNGSGASYAADGEQEYVHNRLTSRQFFMKLQYLFQI